MTKTTMRREAISLKEKILASGRPNHYDMSDDELKAAYRAGMEELARKEAEKYKPDWARLGITEAESSLTWEAIKPNVSEGAKVLQAVRPAYERGWGMVFLWGSWGQAKTLSGKVMTATGFRDGKRSAYANISSVLDDIRLAFDEPDRKQTELLRRMDWWIEREVLFLDELDKVNDTPWAKDRLFQLLDHRYMRAVRESAVTVIASNRSDDELDGYITSRLQDRRLGPVVRLNGTDGRKVVPDEWRF